MGIVVCWLGLFSPGILMIYAVLPWWGAFRSFRTYRRWGLIITSSCGPAFCDQHTLWLDKCDGRSCWHMQQTEEKGKRPIVAQDVARFKCGGSGTHHCSGVPAVLFCAREQSLPHSVHLHWCATLVISLHARIRLSCEVLQLSIHMVLAAESVWDWAAGIIGFCMVDFLGVPAPAAIAAGGVLGLGAWSTRLP